MIITSPYPLSEGFLRTKTIHPHPKQVQRQNTHETVIETHSEAAKSCKMS